MCSEARNEAAATSLDFTTVATRDTDKNYFLSDQPRLGKLEKTLNFRLILSSPL